MGENNLSEHERAYVEAMKSQIMDIINKVKEEEGIDTAVDVRIEPTTSENNEAEY